VHLRGMFKMGKKLKNAITIIDNRIKFYEYTKEISSDLDHVIRCNDIITELKVLKRDIER